MRVNRSPTENCFNPRSSSLEKKKYSTKAFFHAKYSFHETLLQIACNKAIVLFMWFWFLKFSLTSKFYNASILCKYLDSVM